MSFSNDVRREITGQTGSTGRRAFVRRCFLEGGTITNPEKSYHLAFTLSEPEAHKLIDILLNFGLHPKTLVKNDQTIVYLKEAEEISDALRIMGVNKSLLVFENRRVEKDLRNNLNRQINFEAANLSKTVTAAQAQIDAIEYIAQEIGLGQLSKPLRDVASLRQTHDTANLAEIGAMLTPPISKSGVNHRLRKIVEIAEEMQRYKKE
ncbi:MAG: DNA-binding protein WhiA [Defluviitaleaceae bacterium]|nr:DNA-binding protein WhiA [Defluviitaleaceae bacterium]